MTYGESNSGKSNVVLSQAVAIATGSDWAGRRVRQGLVVYAALEGGRGFKKRICAYRARGSGSIPFALVTRPLDLLQAKDVASLIETIEDAEIEFQMPCAMVVIDTLSRAMPGGDENSAQDMTALVCACDQIRVQKGTTVHLVHHSGKRQASGARGHSSLRAAADTEMEVSKRVIGVTKQRDIEDRLVFWFDYDAVQIGKEPNGKSITSIVTKPYAAGQTSRMAGQASPALKVREEQILIALRDLVFSQAGVQPKNSAQYDRAEVTTVHAAVTIDTGDLKKKLGTPNDSKSRKEFERSITTLESTGYIDVTKSQGKANVLRLRP